MEKADRALRNHYDMVDREKAHQKKCADTLVISLFTACATAGVNPGELIKQLNTPKSNGNKAS